MSKQLNPLKSLSIVTFYILVMVMVGCTQPSSESVSSDTFVKTIFITPYESTDTDGLHFAECGPSQLAVGGGCNCYGAPGEFQHGYLAACEKLIDGEGYYGKCYAANGTGQSIIPIAVSVQCISVDNETAVTGVAKESAAQRSFKAIEPDLMQDIEDHRRKISNM